MTQDEIIEMAIQGHSNTRDAIRWAMAQEREACAKICDEFADTNSGPNVIKLGYHSYLIRQRGQA